MKWVCSSFYATIIAYVVQGVKSMVCFQNRPSLLNHVLKERAASARSWPVKSNERVQPLRDILKNYELLAYLSVRATQIGRKDCEIPVTRVYPKKGKIPTKISFLKGNSERKKVLFRNARGAYQPFKEARQSRIWDFHWFGICLIRKAAISLWRLFYWGRIKYLLYLLHAIRKFLWG